MKKLATRRLYALVISGVTRTLVAAVITYPCALLLQTARAEAPLSVIMRRALLPRAPQGKPTATWGRFILRLAADNANRRVKLAADVPAGAARTPPATWPTDPFLQLPLMATQRAYLRATLSHFYGVEVRKPELEASFAIAASIGVCVA